MPPTPLDQKSTLEQIQSRFENDVERFSNLETGQQAAMDAVLILDLVAKAASRVAKPGGRLLDLGCGAGNFTLRVLNEVSPLDCVHSDLSGPMLQRAGERVRAVTTGSVTILHGDFRDLDLEDDSFDLILAGQTLHHLRDDADWTAQFARMYRWLKPGGALFIADLVSFDHPGILKILEARYEAHLVGIGGEAYKGKVLAYIDKEDSPRSVKFQLETMRLAGFRDYDVLHRNSLFAALYALK